MFNLFWDLQQQRRINELESKVSRQVPTSQDPKYMLEEFQGRIDRLSIICLALWKLLQEKTGITDEELLAKVTEIDLSDGKLDGKVQKQASKCPQCNRTISIKHKRCLYCGYEIAGTEHGVFDSVIE